MSSRPSLLAVAAIASIFLGVFHAAGQASQTLANAEGKESKVPLTAKGHVDLQGTWVNGTVTPLERPKQLEGRQFLTDAEVAELRARADKLFKDGHGDFPAGDDFFLAALENRNHYTRASATGDSVDAYFADRDFDNRTSLIVDPPDGKIPYTPEGRKRQAAAWRSIRRSETSDKGSRLGSPPSLHHLGGSNDSCDTGHEPLSDRANAELRSISDGSDS